jgi:hypothetical protein
MKSTREKLAKEVVQGLMDAASEYVESMKWEGLCQAFGQINGRRGRGRRCPAPFAEDFRVAQVKHQRVIVRARREGLLTWARPWLIQPVANVGKKIISRRAFAELAKFPKNLSFPIGEV